MPRTARVATHERHIAVADPGDVVRMLESLGREHDRIVIETMHRAIELERGLGWER